MSDRTGIGWTDATWNPIRGCSRVSEGCRHCYAETVAHRFSGPGQPYGGLTTKGKWNGTIRVVEEHLLDPLRWRRPRRVFVNSMSDLFHENVSDVTIDRIFAVMALAGHVFQVLTKRPERMLTYMHGRSLEARWMDACVTVLKSSPSLMDRKYCVLAQREPWVPLRNVWLGVSVEDQATADARVPLLLQTPASLRFVSAEPLLGPVDLRRRWLGIGADCDACQRRDMVTDEDGCCQSCGVDALWHGLDWVIVGGESGSGARPCRVQWIRDVVQQCRAASVSVFVKQLGALPEGDPRPPVAVDPVTGARTLTVMQVVEIRDRKGANPAEWPEDLRVQQFPQGLVSA